MICFSSPSAPVVVRCDESVPLTMTAADSSGERPCGEQRVDHLGQLFRTGVADDGAVEAGDAPPVHARAVAAVIFVAVNQRHRVAAARIGDRNASMCRCADGRRHAGDHLETNALLVQEQRLGSALIEQDRIAPLEPRHDLALARLLRQQVTDGFLIALLRIVLADVDTFGRRRRPFEQPRIDVVVVNHDVGLLQTAIPAQRDEVRSAGAGADQINS